MKTVALIGDPVSHSVSPAMHRAAFEVAGVDLDYVTVRVPREDLPAALPNLMEQHAGLNVTRPLKEAVIPLLDEVAPEALSAGSVNTIRVRRGRTVGRSTDGAGFLAALRRADAGPVRRAVVLGIGGAARAVTWALTRAGAPVTMVGRDLDAGRGVAAAVGATFLPWEVRDLAPAVAHADLLVNATPIGQASDTEGCPLPDDVPFHGELTVFDLVYRPRVTELLRRAAAAGCPTVEGIDMLIEQGARSFEIWTGVPAPADVMRAAALAALEAPAREVPA
ncbi:MAG: shikimate dehydrogenase [Actinomycetota bacterium]